MKFASHSDNHLSYNILGHQISRLLACFVIRTSRWCGKGRSKGFSRLFLSSLSFSFGLNLCWLSNPEIASKTFKTSRKNQFECVVRHKWNQMGTQCIRYDNNSVGWFLLFYSQSKISPYRELLNLNLKHSGTIDTVFFYSFWKWNLSDAINSILNSVVNSLFIIHGEW